MDKLIESKSCRCMSVLAVFFSGFVVSCNPQQQASTQLEIVAPIPNISDGKDYELIAREEFPAPPGIGRYRYVIYSKDAKTFTERAQTAIKAALDYQRAASAHEIQIWLEGLPKVSERVAVADYYPFGITAFGTKAPFLWKVDSTDSSVNGVEPDSYIMNSKSYLQQ